MSSAYAHPRHAAHRRRHGGLPTTPLIAGVLATVTALCFITYVLWPRWPGPPVGPDAPAIPITVAGTVFNVPPAAVRIASQRQPGAHERIDLGFLWPSLAPPDPAASPTVPVKGKPRPQPFDRIFVTIAVGRDSLAPAERVSTIYPRYVEAEPVAGPAGLTALPFRQGTPYQGEDLIYDAERPDNFVVRCSRNGVGGTPGICLHVRRIGEADVTVRFLRDWLAEWRAVSSGIEKLVGNLRPTGG